MVPPVVKNILIINGLVFLAQNLFEMRGIDLSDMFALHYFQSPLFRWWQMFTHMFMHANIGHIFFNMFAVWMFGKILENVWGPQRFILFYIVCGLGAALCHLGVLSIQYSSFYNDFLQYQQHPGLAAFQTFIHKHDIGVSAGSMSGWIANPDAPDFLKESIRFLNRQYIEMISTATVGASGAVFGLLFAFGYLFPNTELYIYFIPIPIKAKWFVTGYALFELFSGLSNSAGDNVAHFAHLGGLLFAFIMLRIWKKTNRNHFY
jgi:membrane associated rhomboid family serine protease